MTKLTNVLGACAVILALSSTAAADSGKPVSKVPEKMRDLHAMTGKWRGDATMTMGGQPHKLRLAIDCQPTSGGHAIRCDSRFTGKGIAFFETDLFGYDPGADRYHWFAVTNAGDAHDHVAAPPNGDRYEWVYRGTKDGKRFVETISMSLKAKRIEFRNTTTLGGQPLFSFTGTVHKKR